MKKLFLPAVVVLLAAGASFATQIGKNNRAAEVDGYHIDAVTEQCIIADQKCSTDPGPACTWSGDSNVVLRDLPISATMCGSELFQLTN